jgi:tetratricopeptide (TPR) repeat protein
LIFGTSIDGKLMFILIFIFCLVVSKNIHAVEESSLNVKLFVTEIKYPNGDYYKGKVKDGKPHGKGKYIWANERSFNGNFEFGVPSGLGVMRIKDFVIEGSFGSGKFNGAYKCSHPIIKKVSCIFEDGVLVSPPDLANKYTTLIKQKSQCFYDILEEHFQKARVSCSKEAVNGKLRAIEHLSWMYSEGIGGELDYMKAREWALKGAEIGSEFSMNLLGVLYLHGNGVKKDRQTSFNWLKKAANSGSIQAVYNIGFLYSEVGNFEKANQMYQIAYDNGDNEAALNLGILYFEGKGVTKNIRQAYIFVSVAAANNIGRSNELLKMIKKKLKPVDFQNLEADIDKAISRIKISN